MAAMDLELDPAQHVRELTEQLVRERARNAGLEQGLSALSARADALRVENAELRRQLDGPGPRRRLEELEPGPRVRVRARR